jgi:hypothetical protein
MLFHLLTGRFAGCCGKESAESGYLSPVPCGRKPPGFWVKGDFTVLFLGNFGPDQPVYTRTPRPPSWRACAAHYSGDDCRALSGGCEARGQAGHTLSVGISSWAMLL